MFILFIYYFFFYIQENIISRAHVATGKKIEVDNKSLFQQNNLKHQRDIDEHKLKVCCFLSLL